MWGSGFITMIIYASLVDAEIIAVNDFLLMTNAPMLLMSNSNFLLMA
jgi:hypothetical protein